MITGLENVSHDLVINGQVVREYRAADKYLARPGRKQATATEDFDIRISYLL